MLPENIANEVKFEFAPLGMDTMVLYGQLILGGSYVVTRECFDNPASLDVAKERVRQVILRRLYEDQRQSFYDALMEFFMCPTKDLSAQMAAKEKIMRLAKFQEPDQAPH